MDDSANAHWLRQYLVDQDVPCPGCGYNLRGLTGSACPECNQELDLKVALAESHVGPLIALLIPPIAAASCGTAMVVIVVVMSLYHGAWPPARMIMPIVVAPLGVAAGGGSLAGAGAAPRGEGDSEPWGTPDASSAWP